MQNLSEVLKQFQQQYANKAKSADSCNKPRSHTGQWAGCQIWQQMNHNS